MIKENCSFIGYILKPHGIAGQIVIRLNSDFDDEIKAGKPLFLEIDETMVPFFIEGLELFTDIAFVKLEFLESLEEARNYTGCKVYRKTTEKPRRSPVTRRYSSDYIGYRIRDDNSDISGIITGITNTPANPLFEIIDKGKKIYIPIQTDLIISIDKKNKFIRMKLPDGFADI